MGIRHASAYVRICVEIRAYMCACVNAWLEHEYIYCDVFGKILCGLCKWTSLIVCWNLKCVYKVVLFTHIWMSGLPSTTVSTRVGTKTSTRVSTKANTDLSSTKVVCPVYTHLRENTRLCVLSDLKACAIASKLCSQSTCTQCYRFEISRTIEIP